MAIRATPKLTSACRCSWSPNLPQDGVLQLRVVPTVVSYGGYRRHLSPSRRRAAPLARVAGGLTLTQRDSSARAAANQNDEAAHARNITNLVRVAGVVWMDIPERVTPFTGPGAYVILGDDAPPLEVVNQEKKEVMIMPASALGGAPTNNPLIKIKTWNESFDCQDLGAGETILGYKTRACSRIPTTTP